MCVCVCAGFYFKDTSIIRAYLLQYAGSLCCFILEEGKSKKSPQNSPAGGTEQGKTEGKMGRGGGEEKQSEKAIRNRAFQSSVLLKPTLTLG